MIVKKKMGTLKTMTEDYFGKTLREEDYIKYSIDNVYPSRSLTKDESVFMTWLARFTMFFDKSLFFQINNLQRHTELVLSGKRDTRYEFPKTDVLDKEIEELEKMIKELKDMISRGELPQEYWELIKEYEKRLRKLMELRTSSPREILLLGKYEHRHGDDSTVTLYVDNIEECGKNPYNTMLLMGQVLLHEYFHSFYYHVGVGKRERISCIEEPMAEYGSLMVLDSVKSSGLPIAKEAGDALAYTYDFVKRKQKCTGTTAAYGFGAYIFEKHKDDYYELIAGYANISRLLKDKDLKVKEYKYLVYPEYPSTLEENTYKLLRDIIFSGERGRSTKGGKTVSSSTDLKIGKFARNEFTTRIPYFSSDILAKLQDKDYCHEEIGIAYPVLSKVREYKSGGFRYYADPVNGYYICSQWLEPYHREKLEDWLSRH